MRNGIFLYITIIAVLIIVITGYGMPHKRGKKHGKVSLVEAYTQRTLPGRREGKISVDTHIIIVWDHKESPGSFYWVNSSIVANCSYKKVHKVELNRKRFSPEGMDYMTDNTAAGNIAKGDTLDVKPVGDNIALPPGMPSNLNNALAYKINGSNEFYILKVDTLKKKRDIAMP